MAKEGYIDALCRVNQVIQKLKGCSAELNEIERIVTELKTDAHSSSEHIDERHGLLLVAESVRDMLNIVKTGLEGIPGNQRMQVGIEEMNSTVDREEDNARSKRTRLLTQTEPSSVCRTFSKETSLVTKTAAWNDSEICAHFCTYHPQIVNPGTWSKLTEDLVVQIFSRLPIPRINGLRKCSEAWSAMSDSSSFKGAFAEANPILFGLLGWDGDLDKFRTRFFDVTSKEWHGIEVDSPKAICFEGIIPERDSLFACDGGLVCFVTVSKRSNFLLNIDSVLVCNPLRNCRKELLSIGRIPGSELLSKKRIPPGSMLVPIFVELVTEGDGDCYRVLLVYSQDYVVVGSVISFGAFMYDSKTGSWSIMNSGLVYGIRNTLSGDKNEPLVFDCARKRMIHLKGCPSLQDLMVSRYSIMKDRLFVLHSPRHNWTERLVISEYTWESSTSDLRKVNDYEVASMDFENYRRNVCREDLAIFTCSEFIILTCDTRSDDGSVRKLVNVYDISGGQWYELPPSTAGVHVCELRWDAIP
ncbi:hypothetical protein KC19_3G202100 [Ceratodon purpureus]|uniref:F-box domain-containing protein n=1 Tax=Ceratodon purpureus TaxID=3225 RepID=A0A8T0INB0_CERPU|nr:hypothetical protein KC19_3G202100 [Ceratodon purpureus]